MKKAVFILAASFLFAAKEAWAIQEHGGVEAYYVHQIAHVFFIVSMIVLITVLRRPFAARGTGWPHIRIAAFLFILWNVDAFLGHYFATYLEPKSDYITGSAITLKDANASMYYYLGLVENFFLAPAFLFLALGLKSLWERMREEA